MSELPMSRADMALAIHKQNFGHSVSIVQRADGSLLLGSGVGLCTSDDLGLTWTNPVQGHDPSGDLVGGYALVNLEGNGIGAIGMHHVGGRIHEIRFWRSKDGGETWQEPVIASPPGYPAHMLQDTALRTSSGRIILPLYFGLGQGSWRAEDAPFPGGLYKGHFVSTDAHYFDPHFGGCYVVYSDDDGRTWQRNSDGDLLILLDTGCTFGASFEPTVAQVEPGKLIMIVRTGLGRLFQAWSEDDGTTWSRLQPTSLAADNSPAQIRRIDATGHLFLVWNQLSADELHRGLNRTRISCALSRNGGGVWEFFQNVQSCIEPARVAPGPIRATRPGEVYALTGQPAANLDGGSVEPLPNHLGGWSYPSCTVLEDRVLISHTYSEYDDAGQRINPGGNSRLKVMPLRWAYGDNDPEAGNPILEKCSVPPRPA